MEDALVAALLGSTANPRSRIETRLFPADEKSPRCIVMDGAMGTELERRGFSISEKPMWATSVVVEDPLVVATIHSEYLATGCDVVSSATYQISQKGCDAHSTPLVEVCALALSLAHAAVDTVLDAKENHPRFVAGSLGPFGATLAGGQEFKGEYTLTRQEAEAFHSARILAMLSPVPAAMGKRKYCDLIVFETFPRLDEALQVVALLDEHNKDNFAQNIMRFPPRQCFVTFTTRDGNGCTSGEPWEKIVGELSQHDCVIGIGVNCCAPAHADVAVSQLLALTKSQCSSYSSTRSSPLAIVAYPNSGEEFDGDAQAWKPAADDRVRDGGDGGALSLGELAAKWWGSARTRSEAPDAGGWALAPTLVIGGCCRTGPADTALILAELEKSSK